MTTQEFAVLVRTTTAAEELGVLHRDDECRWPDGHAHDRASRGVGLLLRYVVVAVTVATMSCGGTDGAGTGTTLAGRTFLSESVTEAGTPRSLVAGTRIRLAFSEDGRITASAGCNTTGGSFEIEGQRIVVGELSMTEIGCDPARQAQDQWLTTFLAGGPAYTSDDDHLHLRSNDTVIDLVDRRVADPDRPLAATVWQLDGIIDGDAVSSVPGQVVATLQFGSSRVAVEIEGCNQGGADVEIGPTTLRIGPLVMTDMACTGAPAEAEAAIVAVLDGPIGYTIEAASLTLTHQGGAGLMLRAVE